MKEKINAYFQNVHETLQSLDRDSVAGFVQELLNVRRRGGTVYAFGNGGSGGTASHFCGDLLKGVSHGLSVRFKAVCLNDNSPAVLAIANDLCYEDIFIEQLKNFLHPNDLVIGISGSGNSENVIRAMDYARARGARTIGMCGFDGGRLKGIVDTSVHVPLHDMEISEDLHMCVLHCVKMTLMDELKDEYQ